MLESLGSWPGAAWLQQSATVYLFINATHILGIGLLLGSILPLDLRLLGLFRRVPIEVIGPWLTRSAAVGLAIAIVAGAWLFTVKPDEYLANQAFRWKAALLALALVNIAFQHWQWRGDPWRRGVATRVSAALSLALWLGVLVAGRWIGFL